MSGPSNQEQLQSLTDNYNSLSVKLSSTLQTLQTLEAQRTENSSVSLEFTRLTPKSKVYKLVGPVLVKQGLEEAKSTVEGRMGFIEKQMYVRRTVETLLTIEDRKLKSR
jgi:prefoldin beta subunit